MANYCHGKGKKITIAHLIKVKSSFFDNFFPTNLSCHLQNSSQAGFSSSCKHGDCLMYGIELNIGSALGKIFHELDYQDEECEL